MKKVVMAYSGGLDTTAALHWLKRIRGMKVVALALNIGQELDMEVISERAHDAGADSVHALDRRRTFVKGFCYKALKASARYEDCYYLSAALSRPLIATELVSLAREEGAKFVAHGAPPVSNDQFRFELSVAALDPEIECIAPLREWNLKSREEIVDYLRRNRLMTESFEGELEFSSDRNLWGVRSSGGVLEDPDQPPPEHVYQITTNPVDAPNEPEDIAIHFQHGEPISINGNKSPAHRLIAELQEIGGRHGIGRADVIEDRILGFKSREVYEAPAAEILFVAHKELEKLTLNHEFVEFKPALSARYAQLVYDSQWFTRLRESLDAFFRESQQYVSGEVRVRLHKGSVTVIGRKSEFSVYDREATRRGVTSSIPSESVAGYLELRRLNQLTHSFKQRPRI